MVHEQREPNIMTEFTDVLAYFKPHRTCVCFVRLSRFDRRHHHFVCRCVWVRACDFTYMRAYVHALQCSIWRVCVSVLFISVIAFKFWVVVSVFIQSSFR